MKTVDLYLDLDGVILRRTGQPDFRGQTDFEVAPGAMEFLSWAIESGLKISGLPYLDSASAKASTQKEASMVFDSRQARTWRVAQSMIATRYRNPR